MNHEQEMVAAVRSVNQWANRHKPEAYHISRFAYLTGIVRALIGGTANVRRLCLGNQTALVTAILMWRHGGNSIGEIAKYTASIIVLAIGGWHPPPGQFAVADQSIMARQGDTTGTTPASRNKYNSRNRLKIESEEMGQLIKDGNMAGLHVYSILYNYRETSSLEQRGVKVKRKDYWVRSTDCFADPKSTRRNLNALFGG